MQNDTGKKDQQDNADEKKYRKESTCCYYDSLAREFLVPSLTQEELASKITHNQIVGIVLSYASYTLEYVRDYVLCLEDKVKALPSGTDELVTCFEPVKDVTVFLIDFKNE